MDSPCDEGDMSLFCTSTNITLGERPSGGKVNGSDVLSVPEPLRICHGKMRSVKKECQQQN
jgi:hypothetical protein